MTWLKLGGGVLVALAAIAAADTRYAEVTGKGPMQGISHAIASRAEACQVDGRQAAPTGCCNKEAKQPAQQKHVGCCRK